MRKPYRPYYNRRKDKYFLGGVLGTVGMMVGGPVGAGIGSAIGNIGMNILNKDTDWMGRPKNKSVPQKPQISRAASSYGNYAMGGYTPLGNDAVKYVGPKHKDGGILIDEEGMPTNNEQEAIAEVEGGETRDENYIFSDELKYPGTNLTFADVHEEMVSQGASEDKIEELKAIQEQVREETGIAQQERMQGKMKKGGNINPSNDNPVYYRSEVYPELLKKGIKYAESLDGELMINPESSATGLYGQLFSEIEGKDILGGLDREAFANDIDLQEKIFNERLYGNRDIWNTDKGLIDAGYDLYNEYNPQIDDFPYSATDVALIANLLGRQGAREYFGYVLRDGRSIEDVFPTKYGEGAKQKNKTPDEYLEKAYIPIGEMNYKLKDKMYGGSMKYGKGGMIKRADGSYSKRGLWDNIRAKAAENKRTGKTPKKPTKAMLAQEQKIRRESKAMGGYMQYGKGGYTVTKSDRKGKTHKVIGPDGTVKHFGDPNLKNRPNNPKAKKSWYARHKKSLAKNPHFRAYARATWEYGGELPMMAGGGGINNPGFRALPMEVQEKIKANMMMGGELDYMYGGKMDYAKGGGINIDPAKRGTFKAQATRMGMGVQEAADKILSAKKGTYSPEMRRKANFARNFAKKYGGDMDEYGMGGKMKYFTGGELASTALQYAPEIMSLATGIFGRPDRVEPTQIQRTKLPYQDVTYNINPALQRASASYRSILSDPGMSSAQKMAAYSQKLQSEGDLYGQKENIESQRRNQIAAQQAQLDASANLAQARMDEQARQEQQMADANFGLAGNFARSALASASNKFLQQQGEQRAEDLMRDMYGLNTEAGDSDEFIPEAPSRPKVNNPIPNYSIKESVMDAENNIAEGFSNLPPMDTNPLKMPVPPLVGVLPEITVTARRNLSDQDFYKNPQKYAYQHPIPKAPPKVKVDNPIPEDTVIEDIEISDYSMPEVSLSSYLTGPLFNRNPKINYSGLEQFKNNRFGLKYGGKVKYRNGGSSSNKSSRLVPSNIKDIFPRELVLSPRSKTVTEGSIEGNSPMLERSRRFNTIERAEMPVSKRQVTRATFQPKRSLSDINEMRERNNMDSLTQRDLANLLKSTHENINAAVGYTRPYYPLTEKAPAAKQIDSNISLGKEYDDIARQVNLSSSNEMPSVANLRNLMQRTLTNLQKASYIPNNQDQVMQYQNLFTAINSQLQRQPGPAFNSNSLINPQRSSLLNQDQTPDSDFYDVMEQVESAGDSKAESNKGALGAIQIMPATARDPGFGLPNVFEVADDMGVKYEDTSDESVKKLLFNRDLNREFGKRYYERMLELFNGDEAKAIAAYNAGPGRIKRYTQGKDTLPQETQKYLRQFVQKGQLTKQNYEDFMRLNT